MQITTAAPSNRSQQQLLPLAKEMKYGAVFTHYAPGLISGVKAVGPLFMRVKPTGFLLNSNTIGDVISRGDILTVNLEKNTLYYMKGDTPVVVKEAQIVLAAEET